MCCVCLFWRHGYGVAALGEVSYLSFLCVYRSLLCYRPLLCLYLPLLCVVGLLCVCIGSLLASRLRSAGARAGFISLSRVCVFVSLVVSLVCCVCLFWQHRSAGVRSHLSLVCVSVCICACLFLYVQAAQLQSAVAGPLLHVYVSSCACGSLFACVCERLFCVLCRSLLVVQVMKTGGWPGFHVDCLFVTNDSWHVYVCVLTRDP